MIKEFFKITKLKIVLVFIIFLTFVISGMIANKMIASDLIINYVIFKNIGFVIWPSFFIEIILDFLIPSSGWLMYKLLVVLIGLCFTILYWYFLSCLIVKIYNRLKKKSKLMAIFVILIFILIIIGSGWLENKRNEEYRIKFEEAEIKCKENNPPASSCEEYCNNPCRLDSPDGFNQPEGAICICGFFK